MSNKTKKLQNNNHKSSKEAIQKSPGLMMGIDNKNIKKDHNLSLGLLLRFISCSLFAAVNLINKFASNYGESYATIVFFNMLIAAIISYPVFYKQQIPLFKFNKKFLTHNIIRIFFVAGANFLLVLSLALLSVSTSVTMGFLGPVLNLIGSRLILREYLSIPILAMNIIAFVGGIIITKAETLTPFINGEKNCLLLLIPTASAIMFSANNVLVRFLSNKGEDVKALTYQAIFFSAPILLIPFFMLGNVPKLLNLPILLLSGVFLMLACTTHNLCYKYSRMNIIGPFGFIRVLVSAILAYYLLNENCMNHMVL